MTNEEFLAELAAEGLKLAGAPPAVAEAVRRLLPAVVEYAESKLVKGEDPVAEFKLMMTGAEELARQAERAKFGA